MFNLSEGSLKVTFSEHRILPGLFLALETKSHVPISPMDANGRVEAIKRQNQKKIQKVVKKLLWS